MTKTKTPSPLSTFNEQVAARRATLFPHHVAFFDGQVAVARRKLVDHGIDPETHLDRNWFGPRGVCARLDIEI